MSLPVATLAARGLPEGIGGGGAGNISTRVTAGRGLHGVNQTGRSSLDNSRRNGGRSLGGARYGPHALVTSAVLQEPVVGSFSNKVRRSLEANKQFIDYFGVK